MEKNKDVIESWLTRLETLPERLEETVTDLTDEQLDTPYRIGGWTVRQVIHHIGDSHLNSLSRFKMMVTEDHPTLKPYDQDAWADLPDTKTMPIENSLVFIKALHIRLVHFLRNLTDEQLNRTGHHPEDGDKVVWQQIGIYADHGDTHLAQILGLMTQKGW